MKLLQLFLCVVSSLYHNQAEGEQRIVGGEVARAAQFPYSVAIYVTSSDGTYFCGGTLINNQWILTAATCVDGALLFTITLGSNTPQSNDPNKISVATSHYVIHPDFNPETLENDIGLIKLRLPIEFTEYIQAIDDLPINELPDYVPVVATGWGQVDDENAGLMDNQNFVTLTTLPNDECKMTYGNQIVDNMVCAAGQFNEGTCKGDSGGPLVQFRRGSHATQVGISSFISQKGCESTDPSGYTRTYPYRNWISNDIVLSTHIRKLEDSKKKYNKMENVLAYINSKFISLSKDEVLNTNRVVNNVVNTFTKHMKKIDPLFKAMFTRVFYGGSYYDDLRVGKPNEFDLDLLLRIPKLTKPVLTTSNIPGFVQVKLTDYDAFMKQDEAKTRYKKFGDLFDDQHYLNTQKVLSWMESVFQKTLNSMSNSNEINGSFVTRKSGPAFSITVSSSGVRIDIDFVPCFEFDVDKWPTTGFQRYPVETDKPHFFIVPKKPKVCDDECFPVVRYWRLSFQEQERVLIHDNRTLKPTVKLLKKLRDKFQHCVIASYYIKTILLHIVKEKDEDFWQNSLSYVFMTVLKEYRDIIEKKKISYYWYKKHNLINDVKVETLENINYKLKAIINHIERDISDPTIMAKYLLKTKADCDTEEDEYATFISDWVMKL